MKKLYLLLALAVAGMHVSFAQLIWHPNLGTPPSEQVSLSWDDTSYTIVAEDGDEFSPGNAVEEMNRQLLDNGIRWVRVLYIDNAETGSYLIELQLDPNTTSGERTVAFGTYASHVYIKQKPQYSYPSVDWPADRCFYICPGQSAEIHLHDTEIDKSYFLWRTYEDDSEEETDFFLGTGGDYTYRISTPGTYRFDFPDSDFSIKYYEAFEYVYNAGEEVLAADPDGGVYRYDVSSRRSCGHFLLRCAVRNLQFGRFKPMESTYAYLLWLRRKFRETLFGDLLSAQPLECDDTQLYEFAFRRQYGYGSTSVRRWLSTNTSCRLSLR